MLASSLTLSWSQPQGSARWPGLGLPHCPAPAQGGGMSPGHKALPCHPPALTELLALTPPTSPVFLYVVPKGYACLTNSETVNIFGLGEEQKSNFDHQNNNIIL